MLSAISQHHTLQHHNMQGLPSKTQGYVRPCVYDTEGLSKDGKSSILGIKWSHSFLPFWLQNKRWDDLKTGRLDWAKTPQDNFPQREICTEERLQKVWVESKSCIVLLEVFNIFVEKNNNKTLANQQHLMSLLICRRYFPVFGNNSFYNVYVQCIHAQLRSEWLDVNWERHFCTFVHVSNVIKKQTTCTKSIRIIQPWLQWEISRSKFPAITHCLIKHTHTAGRPIPLSYPPLIIMTVMNIAGTEQVINHWASPLTVTHRLSLHLCVCEWERAEGWWNLRSTHQWICPVTP